MADIFTLSAAELAALLCSRVCHDIISPVGAINNGLELLDEGGADEDAMKLIRTSARNASARLQFARIAFGAAGSAGMLIDTGDAEAVATAFLQNEKPELRMERAPRADAEEQGKAAAQPHPDRQCRHPARRQDHGRPGEPGDRTEIHADFRRADGPRAAEIPRAAPASKPEEPIDAHSVQAYYTLLLARESGMTISIRASADDIVLTAA